MQSYVCNPADGLACKPGMCTVRGYALSGGGRSIQRVDVSANDGKTWETADLYQPCAGGAKMWAWCLWSVQIQAGSKRIVSRAGMNICLLWFHKFLVPAFCFPWF